MSQIVYIGGFDNGQATAAAVAAALSLSHKVRTFTFSEAIGNLDVVRKAVHGAEVVTHSAGMLVLAGTKPEHVTAFNPPLLSSSSRLAWQSCIKAIRMHTPGVGLRSFRDMGSVGRFDLSAIAELIAHPVRNLGSIGTIARFDAVAEAIRLRHSGIPVTLVYTLGDEFYRLAAYEATARRGGVEVVLLPGIHDELVIRPSETLATLQLKTDFRVLPKPLPIPEGISIQ
ncbi:MAG TPA: hypothetical protein VGS08_04400 [Candidatus Saccharimonadales bacterium]|nr:hypothetical protein [Candidatus Saccharimonadales bacterium]